MTLWSQLIFRPKIFPQKLLNSWNAFIECCCNHFIHYCISILINCLFHTCCLLSSFCNVSDHFHLSHKPTFWFARPKRPSIQEVFLPAWKSGLRQELQHVLWTGGLSGNILQTISAYVRNCQVSYLFPFFCFNIQNIKLNIFFLL